jgi:hypothetical protein
MGNDGGGEGDPKGGIIILKDRFKELVEFQRRWVEVKKALIVSKQSEILKEKHLRTESSL